MGEYYNIVPWAFSKEWLQVCDKLCPKSTIELKKEALNTLEVWKARCPSLPSGIESTLALLEITIKDATLSDSSDAANDQILRLAYSTAVMRFVNHMFDREAAKGTSLYQAAINLNVPSWVIDLRHDTAHSNTLPTLQLLRDASEFSYNWLYEHYWMKHKPFITDFISSDKIVIEEDEYKIGTLMNFCVSLSICANCRGNNIKNLADIPDINIRESILNDAYELFGNSLDFSNLKSTSINSLINLMTTQSKRLLEVKDAVFHINKALLNEDSLILSLELLNHLNYKALVGKKSKGLNRIYVQCFEVLIIFLHTNDLLQDFVLELINFTRKEENGHKKRLLAALWVGEILRSLKRNKEFGDKMRSLKPEVCPKKKKEMKAFYHQLFPNDTCGILLLDLQKSLPNNLSNIQFMQPIISSYNPYLTYFIKDLLHIMNPPLPKTIVNNICQLAELITYPENLSVNASKVYTVNDLKTSFTQPKADIEDVGYDDDGQIKNNEQDELLAESCENSIWKIAKTINSWSSCPIGILPWEVNNEKSSEVQEMDTS